MLKRKRRLSPSFVPETGLEPARPCEHWSLKPARLPIPPLGHFASAKVQLFFFMAKIFFEKKGFGAKGCFVYETPIIYSIVQTQNFASLSAQCIAPLQSLNLLNI